MKPDIDQQIDPRDLWTEYFAHELKTEAGSEENRILLLHLANRYGVDWVWKHRRRLIELMWFFADDDSTTERLKAASC